MTSFTDATHPLNDIDTYQPLSRFLLKRCVWDEPIEGPARGATASTILKTIWVAGGLFVETFYLPFYVNSPLAALVTPLTPFAFSTAKAAAIINMVDNEMRPHSQEEIEIRGSGRRCGTPWAKVRVLGSFAAAMGVQFPLSATLYHANHSLWRAIMAQFFDAPLEMKGAHHGFLGLEALVRANRCVRGNDNQILLALRDAAVEQIWNHVNDVETMPPREFRAHLASHAPDDQEPFRPISDAHLMLFRGSEQTIPLAKHIGGIVGLIVASGNTLFISTLSYEGMIEMGFGPGGAIPVATLTAMASIPFMHATIYQTATNLAERFAQGLRGRLPISFSANYRLAMLVLITRLMVSCFAWGFAWNAGKVLFGSFGPYLAAVASLAAGMIAFWGTAFLQRAVAQMSTNPLIQRQLRYVNNTAILARLTQIATKEALAPFLRLAGMRCLRALYDEKKGCMKPSIPEHEIFQLLLRMDGSPHPDEAIEMV